MNGAAARGKAISREVFRLLLILIGGIVGAELLIMYLISHLAITSMAAEAFLDILLLSLVVVPLTYFLFYRKLRTEVEQSRESRDKLLKLTSSLEERVRERTAALTSSEAEIHSILDSTADGVLRIDTTGAIQSANRAAHQLLGYKGVELIGFNISSIIPDYSLKLLVEGYISFLAGWSSDEAHKTPSTVTIAAAARKKDSTMIPVETSIAECIINQKIYYVLILRDITDRQKAEEALRRSEERYRILVEHGQLIVWELDAATWRFTYVSPQTEAMLGYPAEAWQQPNFWENHIHPDDRLWAVEYCKNATRKKEDHIFEYRMIAANGHAVWLRDMASVVLNEKGEVAGLRGFLLDITDRKRAEEETEKARMTAEEATKLKDKFVSLVSHDLKGPLGAMIGFLKLLHQERLGPLAGDAHQSLEHAINSGDKMLTLIGDLLNLGRLRTGKMVPQRRFIDAHFAVKKATAHNDLVASQKGIVIRNEVPQNSRIFADELLITEVFYNLVSNAIKFSRNGDTVTIFQSAQNPPTFGVRDHGIGISPERIETIFRYDKKTSTPGTANEDGSGLGLPLSHEIMLAHGGLLTVRSEPGKGSTFFASLPYMRPHLLIVDDERSERTLLRHHLEPLQADIKEAADGTEALKILQEETVHLVVSNVWMPMMNGLDLATHIKENAKTSHVPVIILTADSSIETRERAIGLGADDFSTKPVDPKDLIPRIRRFIG